MSSEKWGDQEGEKVRRILDGRVFSVGKQDADGYMLLTLLTKEGVTVPVRANNPIDPEIWELLS